jgi:hypothetical protein
MTRGRNRRRVSEETRHIHANGCNGSNSDFWGSTPDTGVYRFCAKFRFRLDRSSALIDDHTGSPRFLLFVANLLAKITLLTLIPSSDGPAPPASQRFPLRHEASSSREALSPSAPSAYPPRSPVLLNRKVPQLRHSPARASDAVLEDLTTKDCRVSIKRCSVPGPHRSRKPASGECQPFHRH